MERQNKKNCLFGLIGPGAVGKTDLSRHMREKHGFFYIPSTTTRPPRKGNLAEYQHITLEAFEKHIKNRELLEYTSFGGHYYGKLKKDVEKFLQKGDCVLTLTVDRVKKLKKTYKHIKIICVLTEDPILKNVKKRLIKRGHDKEYIRNRIKITEKELDYIKTLKKEKLIDHFVKTIDADYNHALREIDKIIEHHRNN
ncbi:hypothetical protein COX95_03910 [bacterium CG_4_10_14_0_2_um_filter_33_32]|nr:MAG: hypothetical protein AUJ93_00415 [bacterium CG2_30_33_46]PIR67784.1 MAG: hypothetical protein COU50_01410 [bacterium CG10_big_fil_rev_8_21_14_0_10_33_18]PIU76810.1 MAG: hypothetical protein COS74_02035 [bacterium CG06_land_8_20_14_3_00_33_50]PIY85532.1 MAG: hypothetical protein COY76_01745 [bacterium CG_4_10_14_0_8_um_filter_33_57]PIZ85511.1 MAG: hypothetical protein COX95_03910 [bacterium CG_4_10_14_0_2_um_filter_33_32]PJA72360.1 MAG: hypothetical protein CO152_01870 [bacterium CG_4_9